MNNTPWRDRLYAADLALDSSNSQLLLAVTNAAMRDFGNDPSALLDFGSRLLQAGLFDQAEKLLIASHQYEPYSVECTAKLAYIYLQTLRQKRALSSYCLLSPSSSQMMALAYQLDYNSNSVRVLAEEWASQLPNIEQYKPIPSIEDSFAIGFLSADFCQHPVGLFLLPLVEELSSNHRIQLFFYDLNPRHDWLASKLKDCGHWLDVKLFSDHEIAQKIKSDNVSVLIDLSGHTAGNRLTVFRYRPSFVQLSWLGYWATNGFSSCCDGVLVDSLLAPPDSPEALSFVEPLFYLPLSRWCYKPVPWMPQVTNPPCLNNGFVTFGCFNSSPKLNDLLFETWAKLLHKVPDSRLYLKNYQFADRQFRALVSQKFLNLGISESRLVLEGPSVHAQLLSSYKSVDIALDTFPFNGGLTSCEALWLGLPIVSLLGEDTSAVMASRQGMSLLMMLDKPEWCVNTIDEYIQVSANLASDYAYLKQIRFSQRAEMQSSSLCNSRQFADSFLDCIRNIYLFKKSRHL